MSLEKAAKQVLKALEGAVSTSGRIVLGEPPIDPCMDSAGIELILAVDSFSPHAGFPDGWGVDQDSAIVCTPNLGVSMVAIVARCIPVMGDDGRKPEAKVEQKSALEILGVAEKAWKQLASMTPRVIVSDDTGFTTEGAASWCSIKMLVDPDEFC